MRQTLRPVMFAGGQRQRPAVPQLQQRRWADKLMSKMLCIAAVYNIRVDASLDRGERLGPEIRLTNDAQFIESLIGKSAYLSFGGLEASAITNSPLVAYSLTEHPEKPSSAGANDSVLKFLSELKRFQMTLWLVRDNAVSL